MLREAAPADLGVGNICGFGAVDQQGAYDLSRIYIRDKRRTIVL
jgi:hypothetical protein